MHGLSWPQNRSVGVQSRWRRGGHRAFEVILVALLTVGAAGPALADIVIGGVAPVLVKNSVYCSRLNLPGRLQR